MRTKHARILFKLVVFEPESFFNRQNRGEKNEKTLAPAILSTHKSHNFKLMYCLSFLVKLQIHEMGGKPPRINISARFLSEGSEQKSTCPKKKHGVTYNYSDAYYVPTLKLWRI